MRKMRRLKPLPARRRNGDHSMAHPVPEVLTRFAEGKATREESRQVVRHLVHLCPACAELVRTQSFGPPREKAPTTPRPTFPPPRAAASNG